VKKNVVFVYAVVIIFSFVLLMIGCGPSPEEDLQFKIAQVDSLFIKGIQSGISNRDSLMDEQRKLAINYTEKLDPGNVPEGDLFAAGQLYFFAGAYDKAIAVLERKDFNQADLDYLNLLFQLYAENEKIDEATNLFQLYIKPQNPPKQENYYYYLFYGYSELGDNQKALSIIDDGINSLNKEIADPLTIEKTDLLFSMGNKREAMDILENLTKGKKLDRRLRACIDAKKILFNLIGKQAPELLVETWLGGDPVKIEDLRGKVILLDFWATWCSPCRAMFPHLKQLYTNYHDKGLEIIGVTRYYGIFNQLGQNLRNINPADELGWIKKFRVYHEIPYPYAVADAKNGEKNATSFGVMGIPHMFLVDKKGVVRLHTIGSGKLAEEKLEQGVIELLNENI